jgi:hypothetical protein
MLRLSVFGLLIGIIVCICAVSPAMAAETTKAPIPVPEVLPPDPFLAQATVTISVVEVRNCPCPIVNGCGYVGEPCADPLDCCHCATSPVGWKCVGN